MNNFPRQILRRIVDKYGKEICSDARRCKSLLNDLCGEYRRETNVLVNAIEERVPLDLLAGMASMPTEVLLNRLEKRLEDHIALTPEAARWAVESWALALGVVSEAEIEERVRKQSNSSPVKTEAIQPAEPENKSKNQGVPDINRINPAQQPKTPVPVSPPKTAPTMNRKPTGRRHSSPPIILPQKNQSPIQVPKPNSTLQSSNPIIFPKGCSGIFRSCLIIVFLLAIASVVLFFGVPYVIEVMRETQRERNNDPPRFPTR